VIALEINALVPWAIGRSMAFRAHNTAWRGLRFRFTASYGQAFLAYIALPAVGILSLGLLYPYAIFRQRRFLVENAAFGTSSFQMASESGAFYRLFGGILLLLLGVGLLVGALFAAFQEQGLFAAGALAMPIYFYLFGSFAAGVTNLTYDGARVGPHRLSSNLPAGGMAWLYASNALAILASLGLLIPWSQVRLARFRLEHMRLHAAGDLDAFVSAQAEEVASLGAELGDALDLDLGL
jgi:uncharacterized membrane protein YjgN (DUF898 family)